MKTKTASIALKLKNGVPINPEENNLYVMHPGPEDGRDQNIKPDSNSYDPVVIQANGGTKKKTDHNVEVHRTDEDDSFKSADYSSIHQGKE